MIHRTLAHDLSTRGDGRTVFGIVVPFDREATVNDGAGPYTEVFRYGSFTKTLRERGDKVKLLVNHDKYQQLPIGRASHLREDKAGLYGEFRISQTRNGDEALTLVNDGVVDAFSVGFVPVKERESTPGFVERTEVGLLEASLVAFPAYAEATIGGVRSLIEDDDVFETLLRDHPHFVDYVRQQVLDTPLVGAVTPDPVVGSEPAPVATRDVEPAPSHSRTYEPAQRPPLTRERQIEDLRRITELAAAKRRSA